jgi:hypothetical protein
MSGKSKPSPPRNGLPVAPGAHTGARPVVIEPTAIFDSKHLQELLGLRGSTLRREIRERRLRVSKRAGRYFFLGAWVLEWIAAGELKPRRETADEFCKTPPPL